MEAEHRDTFAKINGEREKTVRQVEHERDRLTELSDERLAQVETLQRSVRAVGVERDSLSEQLQNAQDDLNEETTAREMAEADLVRRDPSPTTLRFKTCTDPSTQTFRRRKRLR
jgi:predicted  nucleic acid-binding Zn-ribbon protein